jgi:hypothetical protein
MLILTLFYERGFGILMNTIYVVMCNVRYSHCKFWQLTKCLYRWHAEAVERSDLKFFMFRIGGRIYPASLNAFRKLVWEIRSFRVTHPMIMGTLRMLYCRGQVTLQPQQHKDL